MIAAILCVAGLASQCAATDFAPNPDQSYVGSSEALIVGYASYPNQQVEQGQTFTVGESGYLIGLNVQVTLFDTTPGLTTNNLVVSLRNTTSGGAPGATILESVSVPASSVSDSGFSSQPSWVGVDFTSPVSVTSGETLAIVLDSTAIESGTQGYGWFGGNSSNLYPGGSGWGHVVGSSWNKDTLDFGFQDFVSTVPEPSCAALAVLGVLLLGLFPLRKACRSR